MKTILFALFSLLMFPLMGVEAVKTTTKFQGSSAYGWWVVNDSCTSTHVSFDAMEGKTTTQSQGKPVGTRLETVGFNYDIWNRCDGKQIVVSAEPTEGNVDITLAKTSSQATISVDLQATKYVFDGHGWTLDDPVMVSIDATWSGCELPSRIKDTYVYETPASKVIIKGTNQYAYGCELDVTLSGDVNAPFNPDTATGYLHKGKSMETTIETKP